MLDRQYQFVKGQFEKSIGNDSEKNFGVDGETTLININDHEDFPIEKARMLLQHVWICIFSVTTIGYGWAIQSKVNIAVPLILQFISKFWSLCYKPFLLTNSLSWILCSRNNDNYSNSYC